MKRRMCWWAGCAVLVIVWLGWLPATRSTVAQNEISYDHFAYLPVVTNDYDPAWRWSAIITPTLSPAPNQVVMTLDQAGHPHLVWDTTSYGQQFIFHTYLTDQGWTTPTAILPTLGASYILYPPIVGPDGKLHLLWRNQLSENSQQYQRLLYAAFDGTTWGPERELYRANGIYSLAGMIRLDAAAKVHATFTVSTLSTDIYHSTLEATGWSTPVGVALPTFFIGYQTIWPDQQGGVRIYRDTTSSLHYFYWRNNQLQVNDQLLAGNLSTHASQMDGLNDLHTFWTGSVPVPGGSVTGLYYQCLNSNLTWSTQQVLSGQNNAGSANSASDGVSNVVLAWSETSTPTRVGIWNGCNRTDLKTVPVPSGTWTLKAVALNHAPQKVCVLANRGGYPVKYNVLSGLGKSVM
ncbi:MAG: hypothetical protein HY870_10820 [Chloroflexi bacterium]|nr:hypothetical protein [Chloroflexota bacterium]